MYGIETHRTKPAQSEHAYAFIIRALELHGRAYDFANAPVQRSLLTLPHSSPAVQDRSPQVDFFLYFYTCQFFCACYISLYLLLSVGA